MRRRYEVGPRSDASGRVLMGSGCLVDDCTALECGEHGGREFADGRIFPQKPARLHGGELTRSAIAHCSYIRPTRSRVTLSVSSARPAKAATSQASACPCRLCSRKICSIHDSQSCHVASAAGVSAWASPPGDVRRPPGADLPCLRESNRRAVLCWWGRSITCRD